jgi:hypothetical protein
VSRRTYVLDAGQVTELLHGNVPELLRGLPIDAVVARLRVNQDQRLVLDLDAERWPEVAPLEERVRQAYRVDSTQAGNVGTIGVHSADTAGSTPAPATTREDVEAFVRHAQEHPGIPPRIVFTPQDCALGLCQHTGCHLEHARQHAAGGVS